MEQEAGRVRRGGIETMTETVIQLNFAPNLVNARGINPKQPTMQSLYRLIYIISIHDSYKYKHNLK